MFAVRSSGAGPPSTSDLSNVPGAEGPNPWRPGSPPNPEEPLPPPRQVNGGGVEQQPAGLLPSGDAPAGNNPTEPRPEESEVGGRSPSCENGNGGRLARRFHLAVRAPPPTSAPPLNNQPG